ncbi:hypothetical protein [Caulobacter sp. LjRoot300]|uniref:hypothetical protein n=1 Tax=Caulobacter sp. LjRoot300 TaxID=3342321 RepID=UPI003ECC3213
MRGSAAGRMAGLMVGTALALVAAGSAGAALKVTVSDSDGQARRHPPGRRDADRKVKAGDVLTLKLAPSGGAAVRLTSAR